MSRGLGRAQLSTLDLLWKSGGVLTPGGILMGLFGKVPGPGTKRYSLVRSSLSRSLKALRDRELVETYTGISTGGHAVLVVAITRAGAEVAREIEWEKVEE
jgi:DNA-binding MarR family transcriptional regulator